jgi:hypothetical protein
MMCAEGFEQLLYACIVYRKSFVCNTNTILNQSETYKSTVDRHNIHVNKDCKKILWLVLHVEVDFFSFSLLNDLSVERSKESL